MKISKAEREWAAREIAKQEATMTDEQKVAFRSRLAAAQVRDAEMTRRFPASSVTRGKMSMDEEIVQAEDFGDYSHGIG